MRIINKPNGTGKTTELVRMMLEPGNEDVVFVAPTVAQAHLIGYRTAVEDFGQRETRELEARFIAVGQVPRQGRNERYVIDEIGGAIGSLVGGEVIAIAGSDSKYKEMWLNDKPRFLKMLALKELVQEASRENTWERKAVEELVTALQTTDALEILNDVLQEAL